MGEVTFLRDAALREPRNEPWPEQGHFMLEPEPLRQWLSRLWRLVTSVWGGGL